MHNYMITVNCSYVAVVLYGYREYLNANYNNISWLKEECGSNMTYAKFLSWISADVQTC